MNVIASFLFLIVLEKIHQYEYQAHYHAILKIALHVLTSIMQVKGLDLKHRPHELNTHERWGEGWVVAPMHQQGKCICAPFDYV